MSGNKWIHEHALKISIDKWSCQISSRDISSDPYKRWTSSFTLWSLLLPSLFVAKRPKHIKFQRACYGAWSTMAVWAMKRQQMRSPVGMSCCRDLLSALLQAGFLQAAQLQASLWGNIWDLCCLPFHLPLCTLFMVPDMVGEHKTRGKGWNPTVACTTNSDSKVEIPSGDFTVED